MFVLMQVISTTFMGPKLKGHILHLQNRAKKALFRGSEILLEIPFEAKGSFFPQTHALIRAQNPKKLKPTL